MGIFCHAIQDLVRFELLLRLWNGKSLAVPFSLIQDTYTLTQGFPKLSMLAFYWGVFPSDRPTLRKAMYIITAYVCLAYFTVLWLDTFYCGVPVSIQWSQEEGACSVFYADTPFYFNFTMNLSSYIFSKCPTPSPHLNSKK